MRLECKSQLTHRRAPPGPGCARPAPRGGSRKVAKPHFLESIPGALSAPGIREETRPVVVRRPSLAVRTSACKPMSLYELAACGSKAPSRPPPSPARGRGSHARPPLPRAGEGWGEGGCAPAKVLFLMRRRVRRVRRVQQSEDRQGNFSANLRVLRVLRVSGVVSWSFQVGCAHGSKNSQALGPAASRQPPARA